MGLPWWLSGNESACQYRRQWVPSLGREDLLEKEMETHFSILVREIPQTRGAWRARVHRVGKEPDTT